MANKINTLEAAIVTALLLDDYFKLSASNVAKIEEKLREPSARLYEHNTPHIGVFAYGGGDEEIIGSAAFYRSPLEVMLEITCLGGVANDVDTKMKRIIDELRRFFRDQNQLDTKLSDASIRRIRNLGWDIGGTPTTEDGTAMNIYLGYTRVQIEIYET